MCSSVLLTDSMSSCSLSKVKPGSPFGGILSPGDVIVSIDNVDIRSMTAAEVASFLTSTEKQKRSLSLLDLSKDVPIIGEKVEV